MERILTSLSGDHVMQLGRRILRLIGNDQSGSCPGGRRRARKVILACDPLEGRITPSHAHVAHHVAALVHTHHASTSTASTTTSTGTSNGSGSSSSSTLSSTQATLDSDILSIEQGSGTTIGELAAIRTAF